MSPGTGDDDPMVSERRGIGRVVMAERDQAHESLRQWSAVAASGSWAFHAAYVASFTSRARAR